MMSMNTLHKTHPMVLVAAVALTIFSLLGSAAITGLIPNAHSEKLGLVPGLTTNATGAAMPNSPSKSNSNADKSKVRPNTESNKRLVCNSCGTIVSIRTVEQEGDGSGLGAVAGGVIGNQMGKGNTLMTVPGVSGGAYTGHTIEKRMKTNTAYVIKVHMDNGSYRTITQYSEPQYAVGDQVSLRSGQMITA